MKHPGLSLLKRYRALVSQILREHRPTMEFAIAVALFVGAGNMRDQFVKRGRRKKRCPA